MQGKWFAQVAPGLEPMLVQDLEALGISAQMEKGGAVFQGDLEQMYRVLLRSRVAGRLRRRIGTFKAKNPDELAKGIRRLSWKPWVSPRQPVEVHLSSSQSHLKHKGSVAKKTELAIQDALRGPRKPGRRPSRSSVRVDLRVVRDEVTVSIDATGGLLHRRGWRLSSAMAPIRENRAAAILMLAGWAPGETLVDPMCGSGTFPIEAALWSLGKAPGGQRAFAFEHWDSHKESAWKAAKKKIVRATPGRRTVFLGSDRNAGAVNAARENAKRAGVQSEIAFRCEPFADLRPPDGKPGLVVFNPPWGGRVSSGNVTGVWRGLGGVLRSRWKGWRIALVGPVGGLHNATGLSLNTLASFESGGVRVSVWGGFV